MGSSSVTASENPAYQRARSKIAASSEEHRHEPVPVSLCGVPFVLCDRRRRPPMKTRVTGLFEAFCASLLACSLSGCFSISSTVNEWPEPEFYEGTRIAAEVVGYGVHFKWGPCTSGPLEFVIGAVDLPLSLAADTVLLPLHTALWIRSRPRQLRWVRESGREVAYYVGNGFKARERLVVGAEQRTTKWNYDGKVREQSVWIGDDFGEQSVWIDLPGGWMGKHSPPWWWGVEDQIEPTAPWWEDSSQ